MEITIRAGQSISIRADGDITLTIEDGSSLTTISRAKPGPKSLPKTDKTSRDWHQPIIDALTAKSPQTSEELRSLHGVDKSDNDYSWALVELQNEGHKRGKNVAKTGAIMKNEDGSYGIREA